LEAAKPRCPPSASRSPAFPRKPPAPTVKRSRTGIGRALTRAAARFDHAPMHGLSRILFALALFLAPLTCAAQAPDAGKLLDDARQQIADARTTLDAGNVDDAALTRLREAMGAIDTHANTLLGELAPRFDAVSARIAELGPAPPKGGEAKDIAVQRADLDKQSADLGGDIKLAKLLIVDAGQVVAQIAEARRSNVQARLSQRTPSPLTPTFWRTLGANLERDRGGAVALLAAATGGLAGAFAPGNRVPTFVGLALGVLLIVLGRWWIERALMRWTADRVPHGRLRRSALAAALVVATTLLTGLGAQVIVSGVDWRGVLDADARALAHAVVNAVVFGSYITGLGRALLAPSRPSWRLPSISDAVAHRLRRWPLLLGIVASFSVVLKHFNEIAGASLSATIAASLLVAILYATMIGWGLVRASRTRVETSRDDRPPRPALISLGIALLWIVVVVTFVAALGGYVALAHQVARQMIGLGIVAATFYLIVHVVEDAFAAALSSQAGWAQRTLGLDQRVLDQVAVVCSGLFRVVAFAVAAVAALAPFGTDPSDLVAQLGRGAAGRLPIGDINIAPIKVAGAALVLMLGIAAIRALQRWLHDSFLPTTKLDPGMRASVTSLLGAAGIVVVAAFALSALGFGLDRIAWVASALSVGIGFGLQAIVQNFVSGLILLIERPVKVGDWVVLGDAEGDIRRINVRATEIQMGDRSTVIVPNSELITKSVRNVTLANAEGRVRVRLPLPLESDATRVREIMHEALAANGDVLKTPAPSVLLDGIENGALVFVAVAFIANPRQSGGVRSELLLDVLARLRAERIALSSPQQIKRRRSPRPVAVSTEAGEGGKSA
jgi:small-conductance mechanosensitive channel